ncbi:MAG: hypothetical protein P4L87_05250, partial [Formivibrio sp.]|nr:hypothetical protein [Formivibrio sp.]
HIVIQHRREQCALPAIRPLNNALHPIPRKSCGNLIARITSTGAFSHSLDPNQTYASDFDRLVYFG